MSRRLDLMQLLESYVPTPEEERFHSLMLVLARESGDVLSRYHFDPGHFTTSGFVLSRDRSRILLVHHGRLATWLQPGGHIEPDDPDILAAARREVREETGLEGLDAKPGIFDVDVHRIPAARGEPGHDHFDIRFLFEADGAGTPGAGIVDLSWIPLESVADRVSDRSVLRAAHKLRRAT